MRATTSKFLVVFLLFAPLPGCGQKGPLHIPPSCSPVQADGSVRELRDEHNNVLPPCPSQDIERADEQQIPQDEEFLNDDI